MSPEDALYRVLLKLSLVYGVLAFTFGRTEQSFSLNRKVQAPVDLSVLGSDYLGRSKGRSCGGENPT